MASQPQPQSVHDHNHVLTMSGRKQENYFKFLEALEDDTFRIEFQANPQSKLGEYGIEFADLTPEVVKDNLPSSAEVRAFRLALEKEANENPLRSHAHLIWNQLVGQIPTTTEEHQA